MRTEELICHSCSKSQGWDRGILDLFHPSRVPLITQRCWKWCFSAPWLTQTVLLLLWAEACSRNLELASCITAHVEAKIISNCYISLCQDSSNAHTHPQCLKVRLEWWKKISQGCVTLTRLFKHLSTVYCSPPSQEGYGHVVQHAWFLPIFLSGVSEITVSALVPSCTAVICPGTHNRCPRDLKSHLHSISRQKDRLSLGKPEHMVDLCPCANSIQPWTVSSCAGKWRQVPGKQSREQPSGRWGWQVCPGYDLLVHGTLSISGCCPSLVGRGRSCVTPEVLPG